jgi:hypothetical protein
MRAVSSSLAPARYVYYLHEKPTIHTSAVGNSDFNAQMFGRAMKT